MTSSIQSHVANQARDTALWKDQLTSRSKLAKTGFKRLTDPTLKTVSNQDAVRNSKHLFQNFFRSKLRSMTDGMSKKNIDRFTQIAELNLDNIVDKTFGKLDQRLKKGKSIYFCSRGKMKQANQMAKAFFRTLDAHATQVKTADLRQSIRETGSRGSPVPQLLRHPSGGFNLLRPAPQIENLVLQGGGAKGLAYPAALREMGRTGQLDGLKQVVGTSAGALTAVAMSSGLSADEIEKALQQDTSKLMKTDSSLHAIYPEVTFHRTAHVVPTLAKPVGGGHGEANRMIALLDTMTGTSVATHLKSLDKADDKAIADFAAKYAKRPGVTKSAEQIEQRMKALMSPDFSKDRSGKMITFSDMDMMHALAPEKFKTIQLTGYDLTTKKGVIFNSKNDPDLPIAFAARISMSHPMLAKGVELDPKKYGHDGHVFSDGGISSNSPVEAVYGGDAKAAISEPDSRKMEETRAKTALMVFHEDGTAYTLLHGTDEDRKTNYGFVAKNLVQNPNLNEDKFVDFSKIHATGVNTFVVHHGKIGTLSTNPDKSTKQQVAALSTQKTLEQINNRANQPYMVKVTSAEDAVKLLTDDEKRLILDKGEPDISQFKSNDDYYAALDLYRWTFDDANRDSYRNQPAV